MEYPKIANVYKFDEKFRKVVGFNEPFKALRDIPWLGTEKVDGTNTRIVWDGHTVTVLGHTDKSSTPDFIRLFWEQMFGSKEMEYVFEQEFGADEAILFGETYGAKIQAGGGLYADKPQFILFDVYHSTWWSRGGTDALADRLGLKHVPTVFTGTLTQAEEFVRKHPMSTLNKAHEMEGLVLEPACGGLYTSGGAVLKCKLKYRDLIK